MVESNRVDPVRVLLDDQPLPPARHLVNVDGIIGPGCRQIGAMGGKFQVQHDIQKACQGSSLRRPGERQKEQFSRTARPASANRQFGPVRRVSQGLNIRRQSPDASEQSAAARVPKCHFSIPAGRQFLSICIECERHYRRTEPVFRRGVSLFVSGNKSGKSFAFVRPVK